MVATPESSPRGGRSSDRSPFGWLGRSIVRHPWRSLILWIVIIAVCLLPAANIGSVISNSFSNPLPSSDESVLAQNAYNAEFPNAPSSPSSAIVLLESPNIVGPVGKNATIAHGSHDVRGLGGRSPRKATTRRWGTRRCTRSGPGRSSELGVRLLNEFEITMFAAGSRQTAIITIHRMRNATGLRSDRSGPPSRRGNDRWTYPAGGRVSGAATMEFSQDLPCLLRPPAMEGPTAARGSRQPLFNEAGRY